MDADRFDILTRSLTEPCTRRGLTRLLGGVTFGGPLFLLGLAEAEAKRKHKKRKKRKKKGDGQRGAAPDPGITAPPGPSCTPDCAGKTCGDDGCGGSCGACTGGTCEAGQCVCPSGEKVCKGACVDPYNCWLDELFDPETCRCCKRHNEPCSNIDNQCCSGICRTDPAGGDVCEGWNGGEACTWDGQCRAGSCQDGTCFCDGDYCNGVCRTVCVSPGTRDWATCGCCTKNGFSCPSFMPCCSGDCINGTCRGLDAGASCTFDAQCASGDCSNSLETCSGGTGG